MRRLILLPPIALVALIAACSTVRLSYDNADWLLARMAGRYVDLSDGQARAFKTGLSHVHAWHRAEELPRYAQTFDQAAGRLARGLSREDVEWAVQAVRGRARVLAERAAGQIAPVLRTLSDQQVDEMEREFEEDNRQFARLHLRGDSSRVTARRADWLCERLEDWVGGLSAEQRARVWALVADFPEMPRLRLEERKRRQAVFLALVREHRSSPDLDPRLAAFLADPTAGRAASNRHAMARWERQFVDMLVELDRSLTPEQRRQAVAKLRAYAADFRTLAGEQVALAQPQ
ncbi:MAG TPA: DUF6279 family lipoprotein [Burkholderiales bacterium]|jgi:hypothetical protein